MIGSDPERWIRSAVEVMNTIPSSADWALIGSDSSSPSPQRSVHVSPGSETNGLITITRVVSVLIVTSCSSTSPRSLIESARVNWSLIVFSSELRFFITIRSGMNVL